MPRPSRAGRRCGGLWPPLLSLVLVILGVVPATAGAVLTAAPVAGAATPLAASPARHQAAPSAANPSKSLPATPDYYDSCAMSGLDNSPGCIQVALDAIDNARAKEGLGHLQLPASYAKLPFDQQMLLVVNVERVDRHLAPIAGVTSDLDLLAAAGAKIDDLPPAPGSGYRDAKLDAYSWFSNALDVDYQWMYNDGPGSGTAGCSDPGDPGCWADRDVVLAKFPAGSQVVMGAAADPNGDTQPEDKGGPSMAIVLAASGTHRPLTYAWTAADPHGATLRPLATPPEGISATGIPDPAHTVPPNPAYPASCAQSGLDDSVGCQAATLAAINNARAAEGVKPMILPTGYEKMTVEEQLFVVTNLERVDRGLTPFVGLSAGLDANAAKGADTANDPPDPPNVIGDDEEWAGGSVSALDADYGWMYNDGRGSGNADCPRVGGPGCWGHRNGILDNFGTVGVMVMGAACNPTGDTAAEGWAGGTSMATTLVAQLYPPKSYLLTWAQVLAGAS